MLSIEEKNPKLEINTRQSIKQLDSKDKLVYEECRNKLLKDKKIISGTFCTENICNFRGINLDTWWIEFGNRDIGRFYYHFFDGSNNKSLQNKMLWGSSWNQNGPGRVNYRTHELAPEWKAEIIKNENTNKYTITGYYVDFYDSYYIKSNDGNLETIKLIEVIDNETNLPCYRLPKRYNLSDNSFYLTIDKAWESEKFRNIRKSGDKRNKKQNHWGQPIESYYILTDIKEFKNSAKSYSRDLGWMKDLGSKLFGISLEPMIIKYTSPRRPKKSKSKRKVKSKSIKRTKRKYKSLKKSKSARYL